MDELTVRRLIYSAVFVLLTYILFYLLKGAAKKTQSEFNIRQARYLAIRRMLTVGFILTAFAGLILIWGLNFKNVWVSISSALAVVAIAFFAVWSLVGNILAGVIIYFTSPFMIEDQIEVMPDGIKGKVMAINTFYTVLLDEDLNYINVPNSLFFQKYIRVKATALRKQKMKAASTANED